MRPMMRIDDFIEAKKTMANAEGKKQQAVLYANCLKQMTGQRPIIFYTNGFETGMIFLYKKKYQAFTPKMKITY